jgi:hypothetical protein
MTRHTKKHRLIEVSAPMQEGVGTSAVKCINTAAIRLANCNAFVVWQV